MFQCLPEGIGEGLSYLIVDIMELKASTQYNDYLGTSAADGSDWYSLKDYLNKKGLDVDKYEPVGVEFYSGEGDYFHVRFICKDSDVHEKKLVTIGFEKDISKEEFFAIFKRFNVLVTWAKGSDYSDWDLDDNTIMIDDRK